jgi:hypothetical protein
VLLTGYGNVPAQRASCLIAVLLGMPVSEGFVDKATARLDEKTGERTYSSEMCLTACHLIWFRHFDMPVRSRSPSWSFPARK